jgi:hypothetical protein
MTRKQCKEALELYKRFVERMELVARFLSVAEVRFFATSTRLSIFAKLLLDIQVGSLDVPFHFACRSTQFLHFGITCNRAFDAGFICPYGFHPG